MVSEAAEALAQTRAYLPPTDAALQARFEGARDALRGLRKLGSGAHGCESQGYGGYTRLGL